MKQFVIPGIGLGGGHVMATRMLEFPTCGVRYHAVRGNSGVRIRLGMPFVWACARVHTHGSLGPRPRPQSSRPRGEPTAFDPIIRNGETKRDALPKGINISKE
eukprot:9369272-Pyramimonas_sp.AAC.1